jgi:RNA polymerase sigma-70 factor (ECF subfamily)
MLGRAMDAEDVVQETFLAAFRGIGRFEGRSSLRTWLVSILMRQVLMLRRKRKGKGMAGLDAVTQEPVAHRPTSEVDARLDVGQILASLSEEHREVLVLREFDGMSYDEIAESLEIPRGTVESRLYRARQELKARMPEYQ